MQESKNELSRSKLKTPTLSSKCDESSGMGEMFGTSVHFSLKYSEASYNSASEAGMRDITWGSSVKKDDYTIGSILKEKYEKLSEGKPLLNENEEIVIILKETETFTLLNFPGLAIGNNHEKHLEYVKLNNKYDEICKSKQGSDMFGNREAQTLNWTQKTKMVTTEENKTKNVEILATNYDM